MSNFTSSDDRPLVLTLETLHPVPDALPENGHLPDHVDPRAAPAASHSSQYQVDSVFPCPRKFHFDHHHLADLRHKYRLETRHQTFVNLITRNVNLITSKPLLSVNHMYFIQQTVSTPGIHTVKDKRLTFKTENEEKCDDQLKQGSGKERKRQSLITCFTNAKASSD